MSLTTPKHKNLIYDVGMHDGDDTDYYLRKGFDVVAFDANPDNIAAARQRFAEEIAQGRLTLVEGAITETAPKATAVPATIKFYYNLDHSRWSSTTADFAYRSEVMGTNNKVIEVPTVNFAESLAQYGIPYYLKADIVGSEKVCLRALRDFAHKPDYLSIRSEKVIFKSLEEEFQLFEELGYNRFQAIQQSVESLQARRDSTEGKQIAYTFRDGSSGLFGTDLRGKWKNRKQISQEYQRIFVLYWLFGDYSYLTQLESGRKFTKKLERIFRRPLPGWYDTHAKHATVA